MNDNVKPQRTIWHWPLHISRHTLVILARLSLFFLLAVGISVAALAYALSQGPVKATPALPLIENALSGDGDLTFEIGSLYLIWKGQGRPLSVEIRDVTLIGPHGAFMSIDSIDLGLSLKRLFLGRIHFIYGAVGPTSLRITRQTNGQVTLTGIKEAAAPNAKPAILRLEDIVTDLPDIANLTLSDMQIMFDDQKEGTSREFSNVDIEITQDDTDDGRTLRGFVSTELQGVKGANTVTLDFMYDPSDQTLTAVARLDDLSTQDILSPWLKAANLPDLDMKVEGSAQIRLNNTFGLDGLAFRMRGADGKLIWPDSYGDALEDQAIRNFDLQVAFDPNLKTINLIKAGLILKGVTIAANGNLKVADDWSKLEGPLTINIPVLAVDLLPAIWPEIWPSGARHWLVDKMDKGRFSNINALIPLKATRTVNTDSTTAWTIAPGHIEADFEFTDVTIDYRPPMIKSTGTSGTGRYEGLSLNIDVNAAKLGDLNVTKGNLFFDDLITPGKGDAKLHFDMRGPVKSVFDYLEKEPISYKEKVAFDAGAASGNAVLSADIHFPATKDMRVEDVHVNAKATLTDLAIPKAIRGALTLSGGPFTLEASENHFKLTGKGAIEGTPATILWHEYFSPDPKADFVSKLEAVMLTNRAIRQLFLGTLENRVTGDIPADVSLITRANGIGDLKVTATLDPARIDLQDPFNTVKEAGVPSTLTLTGTLKDGYIESIDSISAKGAGFALDKGAIHFGRNAAKEPILSKVNLTNLKLGENDATLNAVWPKENQLIATITGASFDSRFVMGNAKKTDISNNNPLPLPQPPSPSLSYDITLDVGTLVNADDVPLKNVKAKFVGETQGVMQQATLAATAGGAPLSLTYNKDTLNLQAENAGAALAALGVTTRVRGGTLNVKGKPIAKGAMGDMEGKLKLENFSVREVPALAKIVNALSLPGILSLLQADTGLSFDRAQSDIMWLNKQGGGFIRFMDGRTSGASLGLTFEGEVNTGTNQVAIQGTVIPLSEVNKMFAGIPVIGTLLTGGKGKGIFAATYSMKGPSDNIDVTVNPLSVLTPGILRTILFEGAAPQAPTPAPLPKKQ